MNMNPWLKRVSGGASVLAVATRVGMDQSTLNRQMKATPPPETVVRIARAYGHDPVAALVEHGLLNLDDIEAGVDLTEAAHLAWLSDDEGGATDEVLLAEIGRRLRERESVERGD